MPAPKKRHQAKINKTKHKFIDSDDQENEIVEPDLNLKNALKEVDSDSENEVKDFSKAQVKRQTTVLKMDITQGLIGVLKVYFIIKYKLIEYSNV